VLEIKLQLRLSIASHAATASLKTPMHILANQLRDTSVCLNGGVVVNLAIAEFRSSAGGKRRLYCLCSRKEPLSRYFL
jgi:hypothetical protein